MRVIESTEVLRASRALLGIVALSLQPALEHVTLPQFRVLVLLDADGPMRAGALSERLAVSPSTVSRMLDRLERDLWVSRTPGQESRREVVVEPTDAGRMLVHEVTVDRMHRIDSVLDGMTETERGQLIGGLRVFADAADEPSTVDLLALGM